MKPLNLLVTLGLAVFVLAGCGGTLDVGPVGCNKLPSGQRDCGMGPRVTWKMKLLPAGAKSNFDAALIGLDLSSSNVPIDSTSGYVTVSLDLIDGHTVSNSFQWINIGDELVAANPSAVNTWVSQYIEEVEEIDTNLNFTTGSIPGGNLVVTEV